MKKILMALQRYLRTMLHPQRPALCFIISNGNINHKATHMSTRMNDTQKTTLAVALITAAGNAVATTNIPAWASSDDTVVTVTPSGDGLSAEVASTGKLGTATITVAVDNFSAHDQVEVVAGPAASLNLTASEPVARI